MPKAKKRPVTKKTDALERAAASVVRRLRSEGFEAYYAGG